jgi:hypothetical protein
MIGRLYGLIDLKPKIEDPMVSNVDDIPGTPEMFHKLKTFNKLKTLHKIENI